MRPSEAADLARQALADGDSTRARSITERLLAEFARYPPARLVRALLAEQSNATDAALDDLRAVTSAEPANAEARAVQARLFQRRGDTDRARMAARQALDLIPTEPAVLESALEVLGIEADSLSASAAVLARVHLNCGWSDLAERHARLAVSESPERVDIRLTLAEALWRLGRLPACEAECRIVADQAEECVRAAVMRAHILSERGRTAEGQELLDRIGRIDPEFREARELLGTLEIHRLVLPDAAAIDLPPELLVQTNGNAPSPAQQQAARATQDVPAPAGVDEIASEAEAAMGPDEGDQSLVGPAEANAAPNPSLVEPAGRASVISEADEHSSTQPDDDQRSSVQETTEPVGPTDGAAQLRLAEGGAEAAATQVAAPPADHAAPGSGEAAAHEDPDQAAQGPSFSTFDWARDLIERSQWAEAERVLTDIVTANDPDLSRVDGLLLEAVAHRELRGSAWKLLGDHYMQTGRPQAAADAYLRAANVAGPSAQ